jgi:hypothetical protein
MSGARNQTANWLDSTTVSVEKYFIFSSIALIIVFAWMEPAGAAGLGFGRGLVFWTIQISILIPLLIATQHFISRYSNFRSVNSPWIQTAIGGVVAASLFVPLAFSLDLLFGIPDDTAGGGIIAGLLDEASGVVVPVTITWLALNAPWILQLDFSKERRTTHPLPQDHSDQCPAITTDQTGRFIQELTTRASGDIISISSELHYLRVTTTDSEVMFLYNLKDAIDELPAGLGIQIHRSHWVSMEHVTKLSKRNGATECLLSNGKSLPVSRRKYSEVKELLAARVR